MQFNLENTSNGYLECMGEDFHTAAVTLCREFNKWKNGPATEPEDLEPAIEEVLYFIYQKIKLESSK